jgi:hypothetical protein
MRWQATGLLLIVLGIWSCTPEPGQRYACLYKTFSLTNPECKLESEFSPVPQKSPGMVLYEIDRFFELEPTPEQKRAADELVERCHEVAERRGWYGYGTAVLDGFERISQDPLHFPNKEYLLDDNVLDPERPEFLMFYNTPKGKRLAGFMFLGRKARVEGPQVGGPLTRWHYHVWAEPLCLLNGVYKVGEPQNGQCEEGLLRSRSAEMLHVWLVDHPDGPFSAQMQMRRSVYQELFEKRGY